VRRTLRGFTSTTIFQLVGAATIFVVPLHIRDGGQERKVLLDGDQMRVPLDDADGPVVVNAGGHGFVRVAYDATLRATSRTFAGTQHPTFAFEMRGQESLILTRPQLSRAVRATLAFPSGTDFLVLAGGAQGNVVGEVFGAAPARTLSLRPGRYFVRGRGRDELFEGTLDAAAGKVTAVELARLDRVKYARLVRKGKTERNLAHAAELAGSARTGLPNADSACLGALVGYRAALEDVTLSTRASFCSSGFENDSLTANTKEYGLDAGAEYVWDFTPATLSLGLAAGAVVVQQSFTTSGSAPSRTSTSPFAAASARLSRELSTRLFAALEFRAEWYLLELQRRSVSASELEQAFAARASLGVGSQF